MPVEKYDLPSIDVSLIAAEQKTNFHSDVELLYLLDGVALVTVGVEAYRMAKDDIIVVNSNKSFSIRSDKESILCRVRIPRKMICDHIGQNYFLILCNSVAYSKTDYTNIRKILNELVKHYIDSENKYDLNYQGMMFQLVYYLVENYLLNSSELSVSESTDAASERMQQILAYMQDNYNKPITLKELAGQLYLTDSYLSRFLKKTLNMNFSEYLNKIRLHHAVEDLLYTSKSVTRIAMDNGFSNISTFNKVFREAYRTSPSQYKESMQSAQREAETRTQKVKARLKRNLNYYLSEAPGGSKHRSLSIAIDAAAYRPCKQPWSELLNIGEMHSLRDYRVRSDILRLKSSLQFTCVRFYNILSNRMLLGQYISDELLDYNFTYMDECIDFLLQNQLKPFFLLGYKNIRTDERVDDADNVRIDIANLFGFASLEDLCKMLRVVLNHLIRRYGAEEVESWCFEVWHPELFHQLPADWRNKAGEEVYSIAVYRVLREVLPGARIGGAEYTLIHQKEKIHAQMYRYKEAGVEFDFISFVSYPYRMMRQGDARIRKWTSDDNYMLNEVRCLREVMDEVGDGYKPIWMTEYNLTVSHRNFLNDTAFKGAYILKNMFDVAEEVDMAGYWLMSDVYSESRQTTGLLYGGNGLITKDGIYKPAYFALSFLAQSKSCLVKRGSNYLVATDGHDSYTVIIHNMQRLNNYAYLKKEESLTIEDMDKVFEDEGAIQFDLHIKNIKPGEYRSQCHRLDRHHGDILRWWSRNGLLQNFKTDEITYLKNITVPDMSIRILNTKHSDTLVISDSVRQNNFLFYKIELL